MLDKNSNIGLVFLIAGLVLAVVSYFASNVPIAGFGVALSIIGALILLLVPQVVPQDAYKALLKDSIANIEILLQESNLNQRAFFVPTAEGDIRAFIPISIKTSSGSQSSSLASSLLDTMNRAPRRFFTDYGDLEGLVLVPPGNEIVKLSNLGKGSDLESALQTCLVFFSDLAGSVALEKDSQSNVLNIRMEGARLLPDSSFFNQCFGSPLSCVAACVVCYVKGTPVRIADEKIERRNIALRLEVIA